MINARDLRIGNCFNCQIGSSIINGCINSISTNKVVLVSRYESIGHKASNLKSVKIKTLIPIPLTEEILLKCGGKKSVVAINIDRFRFQWKREYKYWYVIDYINRTYLTKIEFVHELQNFFHAMNGQELNIKL